LLVAGNNPQSKGGDFYRVHSKDDVPPEDGWERGLVGRFAALQHVVLWCNMLSAAQRAALDG
jgi:hypothetical protein